MRAANTCSHIVMAVAELPTPELVENQRRSIAMLPSGAPALDRDEALELLGQLEAALVELRKTQDAARGAMTPLATVRSASTGR